MNHNDQGSPFTFSDLFGEDPKSCPHEEEMFLYFQNLLTDKRKENFELHLRDCSICSLGLVSLREAEATVQHIDLESLQIEDALKDVRLRYQEYLGRKKSVEEIQPASKKAGFWGFISLPRFAYGLSTLMFLTSGYFIYRSVQLDNQITGAEKQLTQERLDRQSDLKKWQQQSENYQREIDALTQNQKSESDPALSHTIVHSVNLERSQGTETIVVDFKKDTDLFNILFSFPGLNDSSYIAEISKQGSILWSREISPTLNPELKSAFVSLVLYRNNLKPGDYRLA
ncbi:hypothetical protein L0244_25255, partial [bacterium]|nr:hypothetical protein [bacterium]